MRVALCITAWAIMVALPLLTALPVSAAGETLAENMAMYDDLLGTPWTCSLGTATYFAVYSVAPGNSLHRHLYSKDGWEDTYFGYDTQRKLYWANSVDSNGATESQTSAGGVTFVGTLNDGRATSKASTAYTISGTHKWVVRAQGSAGGHSYDVSATCVRE